MRYDSRRRFPGTSRRRFASRRRTTRPGITLLEVVVAMTIFLFALVAIYQLSSFGNARALDTRDYHKASMLCQAKLAELIIGAEPLEPTPLTPFPGDDAGYQYEIDVSDSVINGLKNVVVVVRYEKDGRTLEVSLTQAVLDPALRGSTLDKLATDMMPMTGGTMP
ncbi:MAG: prepilin-type N-terminal cleavage/methylation domain-containing protein [Gemmataceae bacterium]|nr:prepilin-type N-terminal cleavage/methylation domain-containing protein [Gemmataceae bacterium]